MNVQFIVWGENRGITREPGSSKLEARGGIEPPSKNGAGVLHAYDTTNLPTE
jgi:hypothetical protein